MAEDTEKLAQYAGLLEEWWAAQAHLEQIGEELHRLYDELWPDATTGGENE